MTTTVALDAMGGDYGLKITVPAALSILAKQPNLKLILVGDEQQLKQALQNRGATENDRLSIHHASQVVSMDEHPAQALRGKKDSSMRVAINLVKEKQAEGCVSAGNTGALMATARFVLKTLPGIDRPAISKTLPTIHGHIYVLDLGANVDCTPEQLFQFALMGSSLVQCIENKDRPSIGLLNIGEEDIKGNQTVKKAAELLRASNLNYVGYVEGDEIYTGTLDVIVCDGFVGNVALKTSEGLAQMFTHCLRQEFKRNIFRKIAALVAQPALQAFRRRFDHRRYNGASLVGLNGVVIKSHGGADKLAFTYAIQEAVNEIKKQLPAQISHELTAMAEPGDAN